MSLAPYSPEKVIPHNLRDVGDFRIEQQLRDVREGGWNAYCMIEEGCVIYEIQRLRDVF